MGRSTSGYGPWYRTSLTSLVLSSIDPTLQSYGGTDVFIVAYRVKGPSFANVPARYLPEIARYCPGTPVVLVGTMDDLRDDSAVPSVPAEQGDKVLSCASIHIHSHDLCLVVA